MQQVYAGKGVEERALTSSQRLLSQSMEETAWQRQVDRESVRLEPQ